MKKSKNKELDLNKKQYLSFGCGTLQQEDAVNIDIEESVNPDLIVDMNKFPYPIPKRKGLYKKQSDN